MFDASQRRVFSDLRGLFRHGQATVSGAATLRAANDLRRSINISNAGPGTLYVGSTGVLTTDGYPITAGTGQVFGRSSDAILVNATGSCDVRFVEETAL